MSELSVLCSESPFLYQWVQAYSFLPLCWTHSTKSNVEALDPFRIESIRLLPQLFLSLNLKLMPAKRSWGYQIPLCVPFHSVHTDKSLFGAFRSYQKRIIFWLAYRTGDLVWSIDFQSQVFPESLLTERLLVSKAPWIWTNEGRLNWDFDTSPPDLHVHILSITALFHANIYNRHMHTHSSIGICTYTDINTQIHT